MRSIRASDLESLLHPQLQLTGGEIEFGRGLPAAVGAAVGRVALSSDRAVELTESGEPVVLVAEETSPGDLPGMLAAKAIVTSRGGLAAHAAVVARGLGRPAVCGATSLRIDLVNRTITCDGQTVGEGEFDLRRRQQRDALHGRRSTSSRRARAATWRLCCGAPTDCGALASARMPTTVGTQRWLCSTAPRESACAAPSISSSVIGCPWCAGTCSPPIRTRKPHALAELAAAQKEDFLDLLTVTGNLPVTVRLLDAPLHEFLGESAHEVNPMLGLRGVRLALTRTELYPAQARALFGAWVELAEGGIQPQLEVMVPLVALAGELAAAIGSIHRAADEIEETTGVRVPYTVGTMVETPRAALIAGQLAGLAQFLSFGTNDLTQLTYGFSRDDVEAQLLTAYVDRQLLPVSPFASLDPDGVGALVEIAIRQARGRSIRSIKLGICGEHGGDPASIELCERFGLDYVSCSPSRVPGARLAAAHAAVAAHVGQRSDRMSPTHISSTAPTS